MNKEELSRRLEELIAEKREKLHSLKKELKEMEAEERKMRRKIMKVASGA